MIDVDLALAFTTGMVATVNPCGFAMLPAYLSLFLGIEQDRANVWRALVVGAAVAAGFVGTFAVAGLVVNRVTSSVYDVAPWISLVIGGALVVFGIALLVGLDPSVRLPHLDRGGRTGSLGSMVVFGDRDVLLPGLNPPVVRTREPIGGAGRRLAVPDPEVLAAVAEQVPLARMGELDLLVGTGLYVAWYGWIEIRKDPNDGTVRRVTDWSYTISDWIQQNRDVIVLLFALAMVTGIFVAARSRREHVR